MMKDDLNGEVLQKNATGILEEEIDKEKSQT